MFGWFRRYIRKIGIFGIEVEFHPPTEVVPTTTTTTENSAKSSVTATTPTNVTEQQAAKVKVNWEQLISVLRDYVRPGKITTYKECSKNL